jgi:hypothetical protein
MALCGPLIPGVVNTAEMGGFPQCDPALHPRRKVTGG